jgi:molybdenum cofactor biosynthesis enzyme MoaA
MAGSLSLMVGPPKCNLVCPYCVSKMSYRLRAKPGEPLTMERIAFLVDRFLDVAGRRTGERLSGIITGKGEPTLAPSREIGELIELLARKDYVPELQTNGTLLNSDNLSYWKEKGLQTVAISCVSHLDDVNSRIMAGGRLEWNLGNAVKKARDLGLLIRLTAILTKDGIDSPDSFLAFLNWAKGNGATQVTLRKMGEPRNLALPGSKKISYWIKGNYIEPDFIIEMLRHRATELEPLPWALRFSHEGISIIVTDALTAPEKNLIRHGVIQSDGHLYGSWDDPNDIIV